MSDVIGRAYSLLDIKRIDEEQRIIEGIASTPAPDRTDDIVEPKGAQFKLPMPLLWQHRHDEPVGNVEFAEVSDKGIAFKARIAKIDEPGEMQTLTDKAWHAAKHKLVRAVSIGFKSLEAEPIKDSKNFGQRYKKWLWLELSIVTIPANQDASIQVVRSIDADLLAASGKEQAASALVTSAPLAASGKGQNGKPPGVTGLPKVKVQEARMAKKSIAEQITGFEATRDALLAKMNEMMENSEGATLDAEAQQEWDDHKAQVASIDKHLDRMRDLDEINRSRVVPVNGGTQKDGSDSRTSGTELELQTTRTRPVISTRNMLPPGIKFARYAQALAASSGNLMQAAEIAKSRWSDSSPEVADVLKAAVLAGTTTDSTWAAPLINYQVMAGEFLEYLRPMTLLGRIPGMRRVPFNIQIPSQTAGSLAQWVGETISKPVSALAFTSLTLRWAKVANIVVMTDELVRMSNPAAEAIVRDDLAAGVAQFLDQQFITPGIAAVTNVSPASITNGAPTSAASGTTADAVRQDFKTAIASFTSDNIPFSGIVIAMNSNLGASLGMMHNALGQPEFPTLSGEGGTIMGITVVVSDNVPSATIVFIKANEILMADEGGINIAVSREASLQLDSNPAEPPTGVVSLFQQNMVALRVERYITWQRRRTKSVYYLTGVNYGTVASS